MSPALKYVKTMWEHARHQSDQAGSHAMCGTLRGAIGHGLKFSDGDFIYMARKMRLVAWLGDPGIDPLYSLACGEERSSHNLSAAKAIERYLKREPFIWAENKTPARLHVGCTFTWKGTRVAVTSFDDKEHWLVACSYKKERDTWGKPVKVGDSSGFDEGRNYGKHRIVQYLKRLEDGSVIAHFSPLAEDNHHDEGKIAKRFLITADDLNTARKDFDSRRNRILKAVGQCTSLSTLDSIIALERQRKENFRHFDIEMIQKAISDKRHSLENALDEQQRQELDAARNAELLANRDRWLAGEDLSVRFDDGAVHIRVRGGYVETSNGHRVSVDSARIALRFVARHRDGGWRTNGEVQNVDAFLLEEITKAGIKIGCTFIGWSEVDRCAKLLKAKVA